MSTPIPVAPAVTLDDSCGVEVVAVEGITYSTFESADGIKVTATPADGYLIVPGAGWHYDPHALTSSIILDCTTGTIVEPTEYQELPATGADPGLAVLGAVGVAAIAGGLYLRRRGGQSNGD